MVITRDTLCIARDEIPSAVASNDGSAGFGHRNNHIDESYQSMILFFLSAYSVVLTQTRRKDQYVFPDYKPTPNQLS